MTNAWFNDTFLPSLFSRYGTNNPHWITAKQSAICTDNMQVNTCIENDGYTTIRHKYFTCEWEGRKVTLQYSSKNGCGTIVFSSTSEEAAEASKQAEAEHATIIDSRLQRIKNNPLRLQKRIAELKNKIVTFEEDLKDNSFSSEFIAETKRLLAEAKKELNILEA